MNRKGSVWRCSYLHINFPKFLLSLWSEKTQFKWNECATYNTQVVCIGQACCCTWYRDSHLTSINHRQVFYRSSVRPASPWRCPRHHKLPEIALIACARPNVISWPHVFTYSEMSRCADFPYCLECNFTRPGNFDTAHK